MILGNRKVDNFMSKEKRVQTLANIYLNMIGYQRANENFNNLPANSTKMTDPPKRKRPKEALHQERNTKTHQNTETPISAPEFNTKMPHWITLENTKLPHHQPHRKKSETGRDQALA